MSEVADTLVVGTAVIAWAGTIVICVLQLVALQQNGDGDTDYMTPEEFKRFEKVGTAFLYPPDTFKF